MVSISAKTFANAAMELIWNNHEGQTIAIHYMDREYRLYLPTSSMENWCLCLLLNSKATGDKLPRKMFFAAYLAAKHEGLLDLNPGDYDP